MGKGGGSEGERGGGVRDRGLPKQDSKMDTDHVS